QGEVLRWDRVAVGLDAGRAGADVAHLCAPKVRVNRFLEFECVPVEAARIESRNARIDELRERGRRRRHCDEPSFEICASQSRSASRRLAKSGPLPCSSCLKYTKMSSSLVESHS